MSFTSVARAANTDPIFASVVSKVLIPIIGLMFAIAVVVFIYGVAEYIIGAQNEEKRTIGVRHITWGIVGLFIMVSVFGIINLIKGFWLSIS